MVNTQPRNKDTHPGMPDLPNPQKAKDTDMTLQNQQQLAIQRVAAVEHKLMENQQLAGQVVEAVRSSTQPKQLAMSTIAADLGIYQTFYGANCQDQVLLGGPGGQGTRVEVSPDTSRA